MRNKKGGLVFAPILVVFLVFGLIYAWSEIVATISPFIAYSVARFGLGWEFPDSFFLTVGFTTVCWIVVTFITQSTDETVLQTFYDRVKPDGFWDIIKQQRKNKG